MFSRHNRQIATLFAVADVVLSLGSFAVAYEVRLHLTGMRPLEPLSSSPQLVPLAVLVWLGASATLGIYKGIEEMSRARVVTDPLKVLIAGAFVLSALVFGLKIAHISRLLLAFYALTNFIAMMLLRALARRGRWLQLFGGARRFLLVGHSLRANEVALAIESSPARGMELAGFVRLSAAPDQSALSKVYPVYELPDLPQLLRKHVIDEVIFAAAKDDLDRLDAAFLACEEEGVKTRVLLDFFPHLASRVYLERLRDIPLLTFTTTPENDDLLLLKRGLDFATALILLTALAPLLALLALAIKVSSRGPIFYRQTRCGLGGRKFTLYKFRSMREGAEAEQSEVAALNEMDGPVFKIRNDPRRTRLGRWMRRFSLDELPQLFNILKGDMSFVGPRPPLPQEVEAYEPWQRRRMRMPPGLTCLWALEGRNDLNFRRWMELDLEYIDTWSPELDLKILLKTIPVVLLGRGAS